MNHLRRLFVVQLAGEAILFAMFWVWLGVQDAKTWQLGITALLGLVILAGFGWLQTYTFGNAGPRAAVRRTPAVLGVIAAFVLACWLLSLLPIADAAQYTASYLTLHLRIPVRPAKALANMQFVVALLQWVVLPILLLPVLSSVAHGEKPRSAALQPKLWAGYGLALALGYYIPWQLIHFEPRIDIPAIDICFFTMRFLLAYLLFCAAIVLTSAAAAPGTPAVTQPSTVERP